MLRLLNGISNLTAGLICREAVDSAMLSFPDSLLLSFDARKRSLAEQSVQNFDAHR